MNDDIALKAEVAELKSQVADVLNRLSKSEGVIDQLNKSITAGNRMTIWQFIGFVVVMAGTLFGTMYWSTGILEKRIEQSEKNLATRIEQMEKRIEQSGKNTAARFEDLKQVVLSKR
jgi:flagellar capping protein FliD